jgi:hypothetical protein
VQIRLPEVGAGEIGAGEVTALEIHAGEVAARTVAAAAGQELGARISLRQRARQDGRYERGADCRAHRARQPREAVGFSMALSEHGRAM